jgi:hypothetical protein
VPAVRTGGSGRVGSRRSAGMPTKKDTRPDSDGAGPLPSFQTYAPKTCTKSRLIPITGLL